MWSLHIIWTLWIPLVSINVAPLVEILVEGRTIEMDLPKCSRLAWNFTGYLVYVLFPAYAALST